MPKEVTVPMPVQQYAPVFHPDRISAATTTMCQAIDHIYLKTADEVNARVDDLIAKVSEIEESAAAFKAGMRQAADELIGRIKVAMGHYEDLTAKLQESPFKQLREEAASLRAELETVAAAEDTQ